MPRILIFSLVCVTVFALGTGVGRWTSPGSETGRREEPEPRLAQAAMPDSDSSVVSALRDLTGEVQALREECQFQSAEQTSRRPAGSEEPGAGQILGDLSKLTERIESALAAVENPTGLTSRFLRNIHAEGKTSFAEIEISTDQNTMPASEEWTRAHLFWTIPQVVSRYGLPDYIRCERGYITLQYRRPHPIVDRMTVDFTAHDGFVTQVSVWRGG